MENQHRHIKGYRDFDKDTINMINVVKDLESELMTHIEALAIDPNIDQVWLEQSKFKLQLGFMALIRSIAKPESA